jgi:hypothetical protein
MSERASEVSLYTHTPPNRSTTYYTCMSDAANRKRRKLTRRWRDYIRTCCAAIGDSRNFSVSFSLSLSFTHAGGRDVLLSKIGGADGVDVVFGFTVQQLN